ncbi:MAG: 4-hydroxyphenylpyruvate dioxygenase [Bdellovibrionota bacterium]
MTPSDQNTQGTTQSNPLNLKGVDFIEYAGPDGGFFETLFQRFGFKKAASAHGKNIQLYVQNDVRFLINSEPDTFASEFSKTHGPAICATGFKFENAEKAYQEALKRGARAYEGGEREKGVSQFRAIYGIGDSLIYFMDENKVNDFYQQAFNFDVTKNKNPGVGLLEVDHFTNNVPAGEMQKWCDFYEKILGFRETRYFDIKGKSTGLFSKVMRSPCGTFSVPINEPQDPKSQIQEYLDEYKGSGIQHLALITEDIVHTMDDLKASEVQFLAAPPKSYYEMLHERVPGVSEDLNMLQERAILVDGDPEGYLLQIFSKNIIGPIFFEIIQRKNHAGFGNGNFQALFDAIEADQKERGYL